MKSVAKSLHKIALYVRVSTEEQASNIEGSIKSQEQRLRSHVAYKNNECRFGEVVEVYIDRAKSGKDTNRPQLQRLLNAIHKREITMVMVTELSRLSRSIKDFCDIWQMMKAAGCDFLSLREQFDTTTAAGEMVLYTVANIAQFERRQISERVSANMQARAERGLHNGGSIPFGYRTDPEKRGHLTINPEEAEIVREIYAVFLEERSLAATGRVLHSRGRRFIAAPNARGARAKLGVFTTQSIHWILTNPTYIGKRPVKGRDGQTRLVNAVWEAIVSEDLHERAKAILQSNHRRLKTSLPQRYPFLLSGLCYCAACGDHMTGKSAHGNGGRFSYYEHGWSTRRQSCLVEKVLCKRPQRMSVKKIEPAVWADVRLILTSPKLVADIVAEAKKIHAKNTSEVSTKKLTDKITDIDRQLSAVAEHLTKLPQDLSPEPIFAQMRRLSDAKAKLNEEIDKLNEKYSNDDKPVDLNAYQNFLTNLDQQFLKAHDDRSVQTKIIQRLVHKIEILPDGARVHYHLGESCLPRGRPFTDVQGDGASVSGNGVQAQVIHRSVLGSNTVDSGGPTRT